MMQLLCSLIPHCSPLPTIQTRLSRMAFKPSPNQAFQPCHPSANLCVSSVKANGSYSLAPSSSVCPHSWGFAGALGLQLCLLKASCFRAFPDAPARNDPWCLQHSAILFFFFKCIYFKRWRCGGGGAEREREKEKERIPSRLCSGQSRCRARSHNCKIRT